MKDKKKDLLITKKKKTKREKVIQFEIAFIYVCTVQGVPRHINFTLLYGDLRDIVAQFGNARFWITPNVIQFEMYIPQVLG